MKRLGRWLLLTMALQIVAVVLLPGPATAQGGVSPLPAEQGKCLPPPTGSQKTVPWAQRELAPQRVWPLTTGAGVTVGVVDTGVDANIPQLRTAHVLKGLDVTTGGTGSANTDCYGHGTYVAGIIAAQAEAGTRFVGVAPGVTILPVRCANTPSGQGAGELTAKTMADGIRAAVDGGAKVINISASTTEQNTDLEAAVRYAAAADVVVVASAANSASQGDPVTYPASYPSVIAVGAVTEAGQHADFSQTGPYLSLVAPGVDVVSLGPGGKGQWQGSGTSYAAPFVAATAALVRAYHPGLTATQVKHRLEVTADRPPAKVPDPAFGWGTVNPMAAVSTILPEEQSGQVQPVGDLPPTAAPDVPMRDAMGPALVVGGALLGIVLVFGLVWSVRLVRAAGHRGWKRP
jgi:type VII secretion-associated serine protease mycosin